MGKFEITRGKDGLFRFNLRAANGEIIAVGEPCASFAECRSETDAVRSVCGSEVNDLISSKGDAEGDRYEIYLDRAGEFRFRLRMADGSILFHGEGYRSKASCKNGIRSVAKNAPEAPVISLV